MKKKLEQYIKLTTKIFIWIFQILFLEILELISWIILRAGKIKKKFLHEFYPVENNDPANPKEPKSEFWSEAILSEFKIWLEEFSEEQLDELKQEIETETESPGLLDLYSQLTALKQNVQQQTKTGVTFSKTFCEEIESLRKELKKQNIALQNSTSNFNAKIVEARRLAQREILSELLYIHESLERCDASAEKEKMPRSFWLRKAANGLARVKENQKIVLEKSTDALRRLNVRQLAEIGQLFDPKIMKAVAVTKKSGLDKSVVTKIMRQGYAVDNQIIQTAEVEVTK